MVKIIKYGTIPEDRIHNVTCDKCDTIFEFTGREAELHYDARDGDYLTIDCPVCDTSVAVGEGRH